MGVVLAKISQPGKSGIRKIFADERLYADVAVARELDYNYEYKLLEGEWFKIEEFSTKPYCLDLLKEEFNGNQYNRIARDEYSKIKWLIDVLEEDRVYQFQRVLTANRLGQRTYISLKQAPEIKKEETILVINSEPDAIYYKESDKLLFKDVSRIRPIFEGVESLYREATDAEIQTFLSLRGVVLDIGFDFTKVSIPNRRRISKALELYNSFDDNQKSSLKDMVRTYCPAILDGEGNYKISSDDNVKSLVYAIDQRYYTTPITNEKRMANSVEIIP